MASESNNLKAYSETCSTLRHYSNASLGVRGASVLQGLAILIPWTNAVTQVAPNILYTFSLPIAGILFTILLYCFHMGYFRATEFFYDEAARMERKLFDEGFRPIDAYNIHHEKLYSGLAGKLFTLNAPFVLIGTFFVAALVIDVFVIALK
jgi:hypothetical protein